MTEKICRLVRTMKKDNQWIVFKSPNGPTVKILIMDDLKGNNKKFKAVIDAPKIVKITYENKEEKEVNGNC